MQHVRRKEKHVNITITTEDEAACIDEEEKAFVLTNCTQA
jgi:hypothetical protein